MGTTPPGLITTSLAGRTFNVTGTVTGLPPEVIVTVPEYEPKAKLATSTETGTEPGVVPFVAGTDSQFPPLVVEAEAEKAAPAGVLETVMFWAGGRLDAPCV